MLSLLRTQKSSAQPGAVLVRWNPGAQQPLQPPTRLLRRNTDAHTCSQAKSAQLEAQGSNAPATTTFEWPDSARGAMLGAQRRGVRTRELADEAPGAAGL